jgi:hypothetical protein
MEPPSVWLQGHLDRQFQQELQVARQTAQARPLPRALVESRTEWDEQILERFRAASPPIQIAATAWELAKTSGASSKAERREAWKQCIRRIGDFLREDVLVRFGRHHARLHEMYKARPIILPLRQFIA